MYSTSVPEVPGSWHSCGKIKLAVSLLEDGAIYSVHSIIMLGYISHLPTEYKLCSCPSYAAIERIWPAGVAGVAVSRHEPQRVELRNGRWISSGLPSCQPGLQRKSFKLITLVDKQKHQYLHTHTCHLVLLGVTTSGGEVYDIHGSVRTSAPLSAYLRWSVQAHSPRSPFKTRFTLCCTRAQL